MIKANEIRVDNWLEWNKKPFKVCAIFRNVTENELWAKDNNELHPIPLTEEILLKCGFKYITCPICGQDQWAGMAIWSLITPSGNYITLRGNINDIKVIYPHGTAILYLHQLQNLYWCLVGEELEINL